MRDAYAVMSSSMSSVDFWLHAGLVGVSDWLGGSEIAHDGGWMEMW